MKCYFFSICLAVLSVASEAQTITTFDVPGGVNTQPTAISPSGEVTGVYQVPATTMVRGFVRDRSGNLVTFDVGGMNTLPAAIDRAGQIAGIYTSNSAATAPFHAFLRQADGEIVTFDAPDAWDTEATAINSRGEIAGWMQTNLSASNSNAFQAFFRTADGDVTTFDLSGAYAILPTSVSARGQIIGYWTDLNASRGRGFLREPDGTVIDIDAPAAFITDTWPYAINGKGQIVGAYTLHCPFPLGSCDTNPHSFLRETDGSYVNIDVPNMTYSTAVALDSKGQIAGYAYQNASQEMHGFLRQRDGSYLIFDVPNSHWTVPLSMSSNGKITGVYYDVNGGLHGFVLSQHDAAPEACQSPENSDVPERHGQGKGNHC